MSDAQDQLGSNLGEPQAPAKKAAKGVPAGEERTWIQLEENDEIPPSGQFFGHNGQGYLLRPGEAALVPNKLIDILDHAIVSQPVIDPRTRQVIGHRDRMRFPYRRVAAPDAQE